MGIVKKLKSKLLTKLFVDWVSETKDLEALQFSKELLEKRYNSVNGHRPIMGFVMNSTTVIE